MVEHPLEVAEHVVGVDVLVAVEGNAQLAQVLVEQSDCVGEVRVLRGGGLFEERELAAGAGVQLLHHKRFGASEDDRVAQWQVEDVGEDDDRVDYVAWKK